ncbi:MAG: hypothetical protein M3463_09875 [Verrucomicrobiota bacterium]|nr:hypothetical protein [Verrucomicrobiota bacterium]
MARLLAPVVALLRDSRTREFFAWCLPALIAGLILRIMLTAQMPYAFFHDDTPDFFHTPERLLRDGEFRLNPKKTFLVPALFTVPFLLRMPALMAIPLFLHALGLALVVIVGLLCRLWLVHWKRVIAPITLLTAVNPFLLWYEHSIMAETVYVFCTALVALAGTVYALRRTWPAFLFLAAALVLEAGARPEGKLLFGFGILLVTVLHFREWRPHWPRMAGVFVLALAMHFLTKTSQAGLLLYTSVVRITPASLKVAPGFEAYIGPLRADLQQRWEEKPSFPFVHDRRAVAAAVARYLVEQTGASEKEARRRVNEFCLELAMETCWRNFFYLPVYAYHKFRYVATRAPCGRLDNGWLFERQREAYIGSLERTVQFSRALTGRTIANKAELHRFIDEHYGEVRWFNALLDGWVRAVNTARFPDRRFKDSAYPGVPFIYYGVPAYFALAALGVLAANVRPGPLQSFHVSWGLTLLGLWYIIMLTGNVRPRFRLVFEPFWFVYIAVLAESLWLGAAALARRSP